MLAGGRSSEHEISLASAASVRDGLRRGGHDVVEVEIDRDGVWRSQGSELALTPGRGLEGADVAFPVLHGPYGEDGTVQGLLECLRVPYVGAGVLACAVCMDKVVFKDLMAHAGLPQVAYAAVDGPRWAKRARCRAGRAGASGHPGVRQAGVRWDRRWGSPRAGDEAQLRAALEHGAGVRLARDRGGGGRRVWSWSAR